ncbi:hypothetical protein IAU60_002866 [Kwoniella sp. DSM 27419]
MNRSTDARLRSPQPASFVLAAGQAQARQEDMITQPVVSTGSVEQLIVSSEEPSSPAGEDEMAELSDSRSSAPTSSRPVTPPHSTVIKTQTSRTSDFTQPQPDTTRPYSDHCPELFTLAHKAEKILGLIPGTLAYARACLENARDEVRRTAGSIDTTTELHDVDSGSAGPAQGVKDKIQLRAKRAMSIVGFSALTQPAQPMGSLGSATAKTSAVVLGTGGREEEMRRERRRKAVDGVLYWQREVMRLEDQETRADA